MTADHVREELLHDWAEDLLGPEEHARVTAHLARCRSCAAEARGIRALRAEIGALPRSIDPGRDLRPGILTRPASRPPRYRPVVPAAAAALAAVALTVVLARVPGVRTPAAVGGDSLAGAGVVLALDRAYERAGEELKGTVGAAMPLLGPEAGRLLAADLAAVERALAESRAALREDPGSPVLRELVLAAHRQRLDVLRRFAALAAETEEAT